MEKSRKLFAYIVVFAAIVSLFVAGINVQEIASFADDIVIDSVPSITYKGAPEVVDATTDDGQVIDLSAITVISISQATEGKKQAKADEDRKYFDEKKKSMEAAKAEAEKADFGEEVQKEIDKVAQSLDPEKRFDRTVMIVTDVFDVELTPDLEEKAKAGKLRVTFDAVADVVLFKGIGSDKWEFLEIVDNGASNAGPMNAAGSQKLTVILKGAGTVVFESISEDAVKKFNERKDQPCCKDCKDCPFCSFLCKDGKCYCWTMYLVIVLAAILVILLIALIIVKAREKKDVNVQDLPKIKEAEEVEAVDENQRQPEQDNN